MKTSRRTPGVPGIAERRRTRADFQRQGYLYLPRFFQPAVCERLTQEGAAYYDRQGVPAAKADRTMNFHQESPTAQQVLTEPRLLDVLGDLLGSTAVFLQSIYFHRGSEQHHHSDYIYMSTDPDFQMCGLWMACEDITATAGPLVYYPGSHRLPIQNLKDRYRARIAAVQQEIQARSTELTARYRQRRAMTKESLLTCVFYDQWLDEIHAALDHGGFQKETLLAKQGDVLIWHANLVHGGSPVQEPHRTRRSLVAHYLTEAVRRYFDMSYLDQPKGLTLKAVDRQRPAVLQVRG
jgi:ectoine hydroxylase-related dioxygenase (phytanoyl-CoA dioxygenase family)